MAPAPHRHMVKWVGQALYPPWRASPARNEMNVTDFIAKWRRAELTESSASQQHFLDLCELFEHPKPAEADPTGETFTFERGAEKQAGGEGWADVWKKGFFGWEYKGKHKDLKAAYDQLLQYREALENPPLLVVCDMDRIVVHTNFTSTVSQTYDIPLAELDQPRNLEILRAVFHDPEKLKPGRTSTAITTQAATHLAEIAQSLRSRGLEAHEVAHFLNRIVFCLFAQDIGLLPENLYSRIVDKTRGDPTRFTKMMAQLFEAMARGGDFGLDTIRRFNGNLFADESVLELTEAEIESVHAASKLDWSAVDPSIFGTLFERGMDPDKRSQLGAHYTSREDIETLVEPVVMQPLRREWQQTQQTIENLLLWGRKNVAQAPPPAQPPSPAQPIVIQAPSPAQLLARPAKGEYRRDLPHIQSAGKTFFVTFRTLEKWQLPEEARSLALRSCLHEHGAKYWVHGVVVMPDHVHMVMTPLTDAQGATFGLAEIMQGIKGSSAHAINKALKRTGRVWDEESFDHLLRSDESAREKVEYVCRNPVKRGLVQKEDDYRWLWRDWVEGVSQLGQKSGVAQPPSAAQGPQAGAPAPHRIKKPSPAVMRKARTEAEFIVRNFLQRLAEVKVLDPACGSGNFLYVTLQKLKDLEKQVIQHARQVGLGPQWPVVKPSQLYGIEINPYAFDLAQMTIWIGYLQWGRANGYGFPSDPVLSPMEKNFQCMDAILNQEGAQAGAPVSQLSAQARASESQLAAQARAPAPHSTIHTTESGVPQAPSPADQAQPKEPEWPAVDFIVGNPPFLGGNRIRQELGDEYVEALFKVYGGRVPASADLCCYWFERARREIELGRCKRAGLLATQGIRGGANREVLKRIKEAGDIFFAESDRPWILDGANVHVSMVGLDDGTDKVRILDGLAVKTINSDLTSMADITAVKALRSNRGLCLRPSEKGGPFEICFAKAFDMLHDPNPTGASNSDVTRPWTNGTNLIQVREELWIIDFGAETDESVASRYQAPFAYAKSQVREEREKNRDERLRRLWWLHRRSGEDMRKAVAGLSRMICTPRVSKHRIFVWLPTVFLPDTATYVFARSDDYFFGVLHSRLHEVWALKLGTRLETRPRYTPTTCFETFPFPWPPGQEPQDDAVVKAIAQAAKELDDLRNGWLNPPEWTKEEVLEFPGTVDGPWARYIGDNVAQPPSAAQNPQAKAPAAHRTDMTIGTVRYPRIAPKDEACAKNLKLRTLTNLYNQRPTWLDLAHRKLDAAVFAAYHLPPNLTDDQILEKLLERNLKG